MLEATCFVIGDSFGSSFCEVMAYRLVRISSYTFNVSPIFVGLYRMKPFAASQFFQIFWPPSSGNTLRTVQNIGYCFMHSCNPPPQSYHSSNVHTPCHPHLLPRLLTLLAGTRSRSHCTLDVAAMTPPPMTPPIIQSVWSGHGSSRITTPTRQHHCWHFLEFVPPSSWFCQLLW